MGLLVENLIPQWVSLTATAGQLIVASLLLMMGQARGYERLQWFSAIGFLGAPYTLSNLTSALPGLSPSTVDLAARLGILLAGLTSGAWLLYSRVRAGLRPWAGIDRMVIVLTLISAAAGAIPGVAYRGGIELVQLPALGIRYALPRSTVMAFPVFVCLMASVLASGRHLMRGGTRRGRIFHMGAYCLAIAAAINDACVAAQIWQAPFLLDLAFLGFIFAVGMELAETLAHSAQRLKELSEDLQTRIERRTRELVEAREALDRNERFIALGQMASGIAHNVNNPLACVMTNTQFVAARLEHENQDVKEALADVLEGARRIQSTVQQLRELGAVSPLHARTRLNAVVHEAIDLTARELSGIKIELRLPQFPDVRGHPTRLTQAFVHILLNAVESFEADARRRTIRITGDILSPREVAIDIRDTGRGIAPDTLDRIFDPFFSTASEGKNGLGLSLAQSVVADIGGLIEVSSESGTGTQFRLILKTATERPAPSALPLSLDDAPQRVAND
jgi:signal transduction histidine kinase